MLTIPPALDTNQGRDINQRGYEIMNEKLLEEKIDSLIEGMEDPLDLESWAETHGAGIDLSVLKMESETGDDLPDDLDQPHYACVENADRVSFIGPVGNKVRVVAINQGNCGNNYAARAWDIDTDAL